MSSCLLVYQSGSFTFLREDIHLWIGEGSNLWVIMLGEKGGLFGGCLCFNDSWNVAFGYRVEFCWWYRGSICMTAISGVKKVEVLGGVSMFLIFSLRIFQPEYTLLFKPSIVGNFERKGGNTCL